jgi:hypothetical protein
MSADNEKANEGTRYWPTIVGALGGLAISAGIVIPEIISNPQLLNTSTASIEVGLTGLFVAATSVLGTIAGNKQR